MPVWIFRKIKIRITHVELAYRNSFLAKAVRIGLHCKSVPAFRAAFTRAQRHGLRKFRIESPTAGRVTVAQRGRGYPQVPTDVRLSGDPVALKIERVHIGLQQPKRDATLRAGVGQKPSLSRSKCLDFR